MPPVSIPLLALLAACIIAPTTSAQFELKDSPGEHLDVMQNGRIVARYMHAHDVSTKERRAETYKPYLHVFDAAGKEPITKGAGGNFTHHRGIYIGWSKLNVAGKAYDRWHMNNGDQVHREFLAQKAGPDGATFTSRVDWTLNDAEEPILTEERTFSFLPAPAPAYALIDTVSKLKAVGGETRLEGDREHAGLQFRPGAEIVAAETVYVLPGERADPVKDRDYPWFGESFTMRGQRYSVVYFNHPTNPKNAEISAHRDYGRFGMFFRDTIPAGGERTIRARFLISEGEMPPVETIQKVYNEYAGTSEPAPQVTVRPVRKPAPKPKPEEKSASFFDRGESRLMRVANEVTAPAADAPAPDAPAAATTPVTAAAPTGPRRAGGGPENPEIKFKLPPPPVLSPEEALKTLKLPAGFRAEIVAAEPLVEAPVAASWDDQGRLYVVEMRGYMHDVDGAGEDQPIGRIKRLEDSDGDGVYDRGTIFLDKLVMPRAVMALGDGALVGVPPNLTFHRDTNGDGIADTEEIVASEFGKAGGQPEHMANSPTWLMDNWIWAANHPQRYRFQQGKFIADAGLAAGQWGLTQDDFGRPFFNYNSALLHSHLAPPQLYSRNPNLATRVAVNFNVMPQGVTWPAHPTPGVNRGYSGNLREDGSLKSVTAVCGAAIYRGDLFPEEFHGNAFVPEPSANLVKRLVLTESGGIVKGANAYEEREFLTSSDERFRPVNAYSGPDGALYIVDMARGVLQHKGFLTYYLVENIKQRKLEQPINLGRIYRIVPDGAKPQPVKLPRETAAIVPMLAHANGWVRDTAQRVLVERSDAAVAEAVKKVAADAPTPLARLHALWTLEGMGALMPEFVTARLADADERVRAAAVRLADRTLAPELLKLVEDSSAIVRLQLAYSFSAHPGPEFEAALLKLVQKGGSVLLAEAVVTGLRGRELEFLEMSLNAEAAQDAAVEKSGLFRLLAECVMKERRAGRIARLIELTGAQPAGGRQTALLQTIAGKPLAKGAQPKLIYLEAAPAALAKLEANADPKLKSLLARVDAQLAWPGKPGVPPPPVVKPLEPAEQALFEKGKALYALCGACHQPNGAGLDELAPPLAGSEWVLGPTDRLIRIVLHGLSGPITVAGTTWRLEMPPLPLPDEDLAAVLTYVRREWEHTASPVSPAEVAKVRAADKSRTKAWSAEELSGPPPKRAARRSEAPRKGVSVIARRR